VFSTAPPRLVDEQTEELLTWLEFELRAGERHPALVVGGFVLGLLAVSPFQRANGRVARVLSSRLLERAGYGFLPLASLEAHIEELRESYYEAYDRSTAGIWSGEADLRPWIRFFLEVLGRVRERVEAKIELERAASDYSPLQRAIIDAVRDHGNVDAGLLIQATGANRNTLKDNLRRLVQLGVLEKSGERRGTRYRLASASPD
jgi:Fic family protein